MNNVYEVIRKENWDAATDGKTSESKTVSNPQVPTFLTQILCSVRLKALAKLRTSMIWPTIHTNPSKKGSFSQTLFKPEGFENAGIVFQFRQKLKHFENRGRDCR